MATPLHPTDEAREAKARLFGLEGYYGFAVAGAVIGGVSLFMLVFFSSHRFFSAFFTGIFPALVFTWVIVKLFNNKPKGYWWDWIETKCGLTHTGFMPLRKRKDVTDDAH